SGRVLLGDSSGKRWRELSSGTVEAITDVAQLADGRVALVGNGGLVALSDTKVERFNASQREDRLNISALAPLTEGHLLLFGAAGVIPQ
ncbi:hypothetical protein AAIH27_33255, partial [Pseudomonas aeruginosa]